MNSNSDFALLVCLICMLFTACSSSTVSVNQSSNPPSTNTSTSSNLNPVLIPKLNPPSVSPSIPAAPVNSNLDISSTQILPNGSKLILSLGKRFLESKGQTIQLQAKVIDENDQTIPLERVKFIFDSSRPQDISVNNQGLLTALVDHGFTYISVGIESSKIKATLLVSVNAIEQNTSGSSGSNREQALPSKENVSGNIEFQF